MKIFEKIKQNFINCIVFILASATCFAPKSSFAGALVNVAKELKWENKECKLDLFENAKCLMCPLFKAIYDAASHASLSAYNSLHTPLEAVVAIALAVWIALKIIKYLASFEAIEPWKMLQDIVNQTFRCMVIIMILHAHYTSVQALTMDPVIETGMKISQFFAGADASKCPANAGTVDRGGGLSPSVGDSILCSVYGVEGQALDVIALGATSRCLAYDEDIGYSVGVWKLKITLPNPNYIITGYLLMLIGAVYLIGCPFLLIDCVLNLCFAVTVLPAGVACVAFKSTSSHMKKIWDTFLAAAFHFLFMTLILYVLSSGIINILNDVKESASAVGGGPKTLGNILHGLSFVGPNFLKLAFIFFLGYSVLGGTGELAGQFASGLNPASGMGSDLGKQAATALKRATATAIKTSATAARAFGDASGLTAAAHRFRANAAQAIRNKAKAFAARASHSKALNFIKNSQTRKALHGAMARGAKALGSKAQALGSKIKNRATQRLNKISTGINTARTKLHNAAVNRLNKISTGINTAKTKLHDRVSKRMDKIGAGIKSTKAKLHKKRLKLHNKRMKFQKKAAKNLKKFGMNAKAALATSKLGMAAYALKNSDAVKTAKLAMKVGATAVSQFADKAQMFAINKGRDMKAGAIHLNRRTSQWTDKQLANAKKKVKRVAMNVAIGFVASRTGQAYFAAQDHINQKISELHQRAVQGRRDFTASVLHLNRRAAQWTNSQIEDLIQQRRDFRAAVLHIKRRNVQWAVKKKAEIIQTGRDMKAFAIHSGRRISQWKDRTVDNLITTGRNIKAAAIHVDRRVTQWTDRRIADIRQAGRDTKASMIHFNRRVGQWADQRVNDIRQTGRDIKASAIHLNRRVEQWTDQRVENLVARGRNIKASAIHLNRRASQWADRQIDGIRDLKTSIENNINDFNERAKKRVKRVAMNVAIGFVASRTGQAYFAVQDRITQGISDIHNSQTARDARAAIIIGSRRVAEFSRKASRYAEEKFDRATGLAHSGRLFLRRTAKSVASLRVEHITTGYEFLKSATRVSLRNLDEELARRINNIGVSDELRLERDPGDKLYSEKIMEDMLRHNNFDERSKEIAEMYAQRQRERDKETEDGQTILERRRQHHWEEMQKAHERLEARKAELKAEEEARIKQEHWNKAQEAHEQFERRKAELAELEAEKEARQKFEEEAIAEALEKKQHLLNAELLNERFQKRRSAWEDRQNVYKDIDAIMNDPDLSADEKAAYFEIATEEERRINEELKNAEKAQSERDLEDLMKTGLDEKEENLALDLAIEKEKEEQRAKIATLTKEEEDAVRARAAAEFDKQLEQIKEARAAEEAARRAKEEAERAAKKAQEEAEEAARRAKEEAEKAAQKAEEEAKEAAKKAEEEAKEAARKAQEEYEKRLKAWKEYQDENRTFMEKLFGVELSEKEIERRKRRQEIFERMKAKWEAIEERRKKESEAIQQSQERVRALENADDSGEQ